MSRSYKARFNKGKNVGRKYFSKILEQISFDNIRCCITGGGPIAPEVVRDYLCLGVEFMQGYGMTETSPILTLNPLGSNNTRSVGKVLDGITAEIRDKDESGSGVLCVKGPNVMMGYYNNPEATREIILPDGFLVTGDVGIIDKDGYFYITGRAKNIIVTSGGKNVFPEEIEEEFSSSKLIEQIVVVGYKKEGLEGEAVRALCYPSKFLRDKYKDKWGGMKKEIEKEVLSVNKRLRSYKKIESVLVVKEPFETTTTKKIKRKDLDEKIKNAI